MTELQLIRVMIVDDHPIVRDGLKNMLLAFDDLKLVGEAADGSQALAHCGQAQPDVILMDMAMPGMDGIATTRALLAHYPQMKVIMLTSFVEDKLVQNALEAGAAGYLLKNAPINTLADAIRSVYTGQSVLSPEATSALIRTKTGPREPGQDLTRTRTRGPGADRSRPEQRRDRRTLGDQYRHGPAPCQRLPPEAGRRQSRAGRGAGNQVPSGPLISHNVNTPRTSSYRGRRRFAKSPYLAERPAKDRLIGPSRNEQCSRCARAECARYSCQAFIA